MIGRTIGHYRILAHLGGGGMGVVYKAEDTRLGRTVALKLLPPELTRDPDAKRRFEREARAASLLDHPNICTVYDFGETDDGQMYIAMACYDGESLAERITRGPVLSLDDAIRIVEQVCHGLGHAHASGVIHRDVKPANVMLTASGIVKIVDFGLAKLQAGSQLTKSRTSLGTVAYMAPEQLRGEEIGPQADIWASGVLLFELLTGTRPFRGDYSEALSYAILNEQPATITDRRPDLPPEIDRIIKKMLRKDPLQRYATTGEVAAELEVLRTPSSGSGKSGPRSAKLREPLRAGAKLGPYEIVEPLGSGGMGDVYRARDTRLDRQVALKVLAPEFSEDAERKQRFQREAKTISSLSHPNICTLFDVGEQEGTDYLVMEYLEGETLAERIARGAVGLAEFLKLGIQISEALGKAHQQGVIHRDLKPANVILTTGGVVKLLDFGLAKGIASVLEESGSGSGRRRRKPLSADGPPENREATPSPERPLTAEGAIVGTLPYMAPEQVEGREADARSDIFALGAILYEMATGRRAFEGATKASLIAAILTAEPAALAELRVEGGSSSSVARSLAPIERAVRQALEKDPDRRWQGALDVANELRWVADHGSAVLPRSARAASRRASRLVAALCLLLLASAGTAGWLGWKLLHPEAPPPRPIPKVTQLTWGKGVRSGGAISPDGANFVYVSDETGNPDIFFRRIGGERAVNLTADCREGDGTPAFSPDGGSIVFQSSCDGGGIFIMGATGESRRRLTNFGWGPDWSPDGRSILFSGANSIWVADVATGTTKKVVDGNASHGEWSPSGSRIVFNSIRPGRAPAIATITAGGGTPTIVHELSGTIWGPLDWSRGWIWFSSWAGSTLWIWRIPVDDATGARTGAAEPVTVGGAAASQPSVTPDGLRVVYPSQHFKYTLERRAIDPASGTVVGAMSEVVTGPIDLEYKVVSPDNESIALTLWENDTAKIGVLRASTGELRRLTGDGPKREPFAWAPDGSRIYFTLYTTPPELWSIRPDGSGMELVMAAPESAGLEGAAVSGDGRWLFADAGDAAGMSAVDLFLRLAQRKLVPLPPLPNGRAFTAGDLAAGDLVGQASPDGRWLVGRSERVAGTKPYESYVYDVANRTYRELPALDPDAWRGWLPDSRRLLVALDAKLGVLDVGTGASTPAGSLGKSSRWPALSNDGRWLFTVRVDAEIELFLLEYPEAK